MEKAALRVEAADLEEESSDAASIGAYPLEPWSTYVPNLVVVCSTVAPVILQSGAVQASATQSSSVQLEIFGQNMSCIARTYIFCCTDSTLRDLTETRVSLGAEEVFRVDCPVKSAENLNALVVVATAVPPLLVAKILREPPSALAFVDLPEATTT